ELLGLRQRFVVALVGNRHLKWRRGVALARDISVPMRFEAEIVKRRNGRERLEKITFGSVLVELPRIKEQLRLVKVQFKRGGTLLLLTNVEMKNTLKDVLWVARAYVARWRVEEVIRFIKQSYKLKDVRLRSYNGLRNMTALVMACASFVSLQLGLQAKLQILTRKLFCTSQRVGDIIKNFRYYAIADGLKETLRSSANPWREPKPPSSHQMTILLAAPTGGSLM
ncbi:transposase, partial [bacterium]|nr:transposase [bacterium]